MILDIKEEDKRKTDPADWWPDWDLCGCKFSVLFLSRRKAEGERMVEDCKLCQSAVFTYTPL